MKLHPVRIHRRHFIWIWMAVFAAGCAGTVAPEAPDTPGAPRTQAPLDDRSTHAADGRHDRSAVFPVAIENFTFRPETLEISQGMTVVWKNADDVPHTVRSTEDLFRSGTLDTDDVYEHLFIEPGTYEYYCGVHRHMSGRIVVK